MTLSIKKQRHDSRIKLIMQNSPMALSMSRGERILSLRDTVVQPPISMLRNFRTGRVPHPRGKNPQCFVRTSAHWFHTSVAGKLSFTWRRQTHWLYTRSFGKIGKINVLRSEWWRSYRKHSRVHFQHVLASLSSSSRKLFDSACPIYRTKALQTVLSGHFFQLHVGRGATELGKLQRLTECEDRCEPNGW